MTQTAPKWYWQTYLTTLSNMATLTGTRLDKQTPWSIGVQITLVDNRLDIVLTDKGMPMPNAEPPISNASNTDVHFIDLPAGGFGGFCLRCLHHTLPKSEQATSVHQPSTYRYA